MLTGIAQYINEMAIHNGWPEIRKKYARRHHLAPYIAADLKQRQWQRKGAELESPLTPEQVKMVCDHLQLVRKYAGAIARGNQPLFAELEVLGLSILEQKARDYDSSRNVTFGAHALKRVRGAMLDHVMLHRNRTLAVGGIKEIDIVNSRPGLSDRGLLELLTLPEKHRWNAPRKRKPRPSGYMADIEKLLLKLNRKQQAVYRGRVLTDPPLSRAALARQLGIAHVTQISRIERQAERKMAKWLKKSAKT
jgi:hypothetical protein